MAFELPDLPYPEDALAPHISAETLRYHHGKHHAGYVAKLNGLIEGTEHESSSLEDIIGAAAPGPLFNNAAQVWNHTFYWNGMSPDGGDAPTGSLGHRIDTAFGSYDSFRQEFTAAATGNFASGWTWLVADGDELSVVNTDDADNPLTRGMTPLLTLDVWEHAYYLDRQNDRAAYVQAWLDHLIDWSSVERQLGR